MKFPMHTLITQATFMRCKIAKLRVGRYYCQQLGSTLAIFEFPLFTVFVQFCYDFGLTFRSLVKKQVPFCYTLSEFDWILVSSPRPHCDGRPRYEPQALSLQHLWRNPAWEVRRFLDDGIPNTHYRIYNLCAEMPHSSGLFHDR